eukprot:CCRYP_006769-RA/>CCRYP_006769-RA protein AED:0.55 eAED:0.49 QI:64/0/0/1/0/0/2/0/227
MANVISLKTLEQKFHVTYDSTSKVAVVFKRCPVTKFPYVDLSQDKSGAAAMLVQTICQNFEGYMCEEVERAILARKMQSRSGHPSETAFKKEDIANARKIFGPSTPCITGKWVRRRPDAVRPEYITVPEQLISMNKYMTLAANVMFVSGVPFLVTLPWRVRYVTVQFLPRRTAGELADALKMVIGVYRCAGFICQTALMDREFDKVKQKLLNLIGVNVTSKYEPCRR